MSKRIWKNGLISILCIVLFFVNILSMGISAFATEMDVDIMVLPENLNEESIEIGIDSTKNKEEDDNIKEGGAEGKKTVEKSSEDDGEEQEDTENLLESEKLQKDEQNNQNYKTEMISDVEVVSGICGENLNFTLNDDGILVIKGDGRMETSYFSNPWEDYRSEIKSVIIEDGVTCIGDSAFHSCINLENIEMPSSITSIGRGAFISCQSLTNIEIPSNLTDIGDHAFGGCERLTNIEIPSSVINIGESAFSNCKNLISVNMPTGITSIKYRTFYGCDSLINVNIPPAVTDIGNAAFSGCSSLINIDIPSGVTRIEIGAFEKCSSLVNVNIPSSITEIGMNVFSGCSNLMNIDIPFGVSRLGIYAFKGCSSLTNVNIPSSVIEIGSGAFSDCSSLSTVKFFNSECAIEDSSNTISDNAVIYGYTNSTAQVYAEKHSRTFAVLQKSDETADHIKALMPKCGYQFCGLSLPTVCEVQFNQNVKEYNDNGYIALIEYNNSNKVIEKYNLDNDEKVSIHDNVVDVRFTEILSSDTQYAIIISDNALTFEDGTMISEFDENVWNFKTCRLEYSLKRNPTEKIKAGIYEKFYKPLTALKLRLFHDGTRGTCFGIAYAAGAWDKRYKAISTYGANGNTIKNFELATKEEMSYSFLEYIQLAYIYQFSSYMKKELENSENQFDKLYALIKKYQSDEGLPIMICVCDYKGRGHAVVPVGIISEDNDSVRIAVYDCNGGHEPFHFLDEFILKKSDGKITDWEFSDYNNRDEKKGKLCFFEMDECIDSAILYSNYEESNNLVFSKSEITNLEEIISYSGELGEENYLYWTDNSTISRMKNSDTDLSEIGITDGYKEVSANVPLNANVTLNLNSNTIQTSFDEISDYNVTFRNIENDSISFISIEGKATGELLAKQTDEGIILEVNDLSNITVSTGNDVSNIEKTFSSLKDSVLIKEKNNIITIYEDSDGNGTYDKQIIDIDDEQSIMASGKCGDNLIWMLESDVLKISGTGEMYDYMGGYAENSGGAPWGQLNYTSVIFEEGITKIGKCAFYESNICGTVIIPSSVQEINQDAFYKCTNITEVQFIENSNENCEVTIGQLAFYGCNNLKNIQFSSNVKRIYDRPFAGCSSLEKLALPPYVEYLGGGITYGTNIFEIIIPKSVNKFVRKLGSEGIVGENGSLKIIKFEEGTSKILYGILDDCKEVIVEFPKSVSSFENSINGCKSNIFVFHGDVPDFKGINNDGVSFVYYPENRDEWNKVEIRELFDASTIWIPYAEDTTPWLLDTSSDTPQIFITPTSDKNVTYLENEGYSPKSFSIDFSALYMYFASSEEEMITYNNTKISITLPEGLSFSETSNVDQKEYPIGTMDYTDENRRKDFKDTVYITTSEKVEKFDIPLEVTADGYTKAQKVILEVPVKEEINYSLYDIQVYSEYANLFIGENQTCAILPAMVKEDVPLMNEEGWNFSIENPEIADIQEYVDTEFGPAAQIIGKSVGSTRLQIIHIPTGRMVNLTIGVGQNILTYELADIVNLSENAGIMNYGIFTKDFTSQKISDGYLVTFKAYNECASSGAVEVYNAENELIEAAQIKKFEPYQTGIKEVVKDGWNLICSAVNGSITNVTNSMYTKETPISIKVPEGGYFIITNDTNKSVPVALYNAVDVFVWLYKEKGIITKWENKDPFEDKVKDDLSQSVITYFLQQKDDKKVWSRFQENLTKSLSKKSMNVEQGVNIAIALYNNVDMALSELDIDIGKEITDAALDTGIEVAMDLFKEFSPTGDVIEALFDVNKTLNGFMQMVYINKTFDSRQIRVDAIGDGSKLVSEGVIVESNVGSLPKDSELAVIDITKEETSQYIIKNFENSSQIKIYDITLYRDKTEIQPEGFLITVKIPLPPLYNAERCMVYRAESDGSFTNMNAQYIDGYMVFETEHLSKYVLVEVAEKESIENGDILPEDIPTDGIIPDGLWAAGITDTTYTGAAVIQSFRLYDGTTRLQEKTDYTVSYKNNKAAYTYTDEDYAAFEQNLADTGTRTKTGAFNPAKAPQVIIKMKGNYAGTRILYFRIQPADISGDEFTANDVAATYSGKKQTPAPVLSWKGKALKYGTDFYIPEYDSAKNNKTAFTQSGTYELTITGKNNFTDVIPVTLTISAGTKQIAMNKVTVKGIKNQPWTGSQIMPSGFTVKCQKDVLSETNGDYMVSFGENTDVGTGTVILTGTGTDADGDGYSYIGTKTISFQITGTAMNKVTVSGVEKSYSYTGDVIEPHAVLTYQADKSSSPVTLTEDFHYTVDYQKNTDKGTATITFTGLASGGYTGTKKQTFRITSSGIEDRTNGDATVEMIQISFQKTSNMQDGVYVAPYMKGGAVPEVVVTSGGKTLQSGRDYILSYRNNKKPALSTDTNAPTVIVKGKGNYTGSKQVAFTIATKALTNENGIRVVAADKAASVKKNGYRQKFKIYDADGKTLGTNDYDKTNVTYTLIQTEDADGIVNEKNEQLDQNSIVPAGSVIQITVQGKGVYVGGSATGTYRILNSGYDISKATIQINNQSYTGKPVLITEQEQFKEGKVYVKIGKEKRALILGQDIEVVPDSYIRNVTKGTAKVTFRGINSFGGTKTVSYKIGVRSISEFWKGIFNQVNRIFSMEKVAVPFLKERLETA